MHKRYDWDAVTTAQWYLYTGKWQLDTEQPGDLIYLNHPYYNLRGTTMGPLTHIPNPKQPFTQITTVTSQTILMHPPKHPNTKIRLMRLTRQDAKGQLS